MKFLLVVACAAFAAAAPEAQFAYTVGAAPMVYPYAAQYVIPAVAAGCRNEAGSVVPCAGAVPFVAPIAVAAAPAAAEAAAPAEAAPAVEAVDRKRREAEPEATAEATADATADAEADPWLYYSSFYGAAPYSYYAPYSYSYSYAPYSYSYYPYSWYNPYGYAYYGRKKREAEAAPEAAPEAEADPYLYYSYPYAYSAYNYAPYAYSYALPYYGGCRNNWGAAVPCA